MVGLRYKDKLGRFIHGVPARDLTEAEVEKYGGEKALLKSGFYEKPPKPRKGKVEVGDGN